MTVQPFPSKEPQREVNLQYPEPKTKITQKGQKELHRSMKQENYIARAFLQENIHGPNHAIPVANSEPNSWPNVAPAPMNPNNLEPD